MNGSEIILFIYAYLMGFVFLQFAYDRAFRLKLIPEANYQINRYWFIPVINIGLALFILVRNEFRAFKIRKK